MKCQDPTNGCIAPVQAGYCANRRHILTSFVSLSGLFFSSRDAFGKASPDLLPLKPKRSSRNPKVYAHWFFFPLSLDNKEASDDYYTKNYLSPSGEGGKFAQVGGYIRERPLKVSVQPKETWWEDNILRDIRMAIDSGIDGFHIDILDLLPSDHSLALYRSTADVIRKNNLQFSLIPCIDCTSSLSSVTTNEIADFLIEACERDCIAKSSKGFPIVSGFCVEKWDSKRWEEILRRVTEKIGEISFFPIFLDLKKADNGLLAKSDIASIWSGDMLAEVPGMASAAEAVRKLGVEWCEPVWAQDFRPKDKWYTEAHNSLLFRKNWEQAISINATVVLILTWNDYSEGSEIRPSTGIQSSYADICAYYSRWLKSGSPPEIKREAIYYFHRIQKDTAEYGSDQGARITLRDGESVSNEIELVSILSRPGTISISTSSGTVSRAVGGGVSAMTVPLAPGRPTFRLKRNGVVLIELQSDFVIQSASPFQDFLYRGGGSARWL